MRRPDSTVADWIIAVSAFLLAAVVTFATSSAMTAHAPTFARPALLALTVGAIVGACLLRVWLTRSMLAGIAMGTLLSASIGAHLLAITP
jgi:hypothetical protein